jgi:predicted GNAT family N-acyltransferase
VSRQVRLARPDDLPAAYALRLDVFVAEQGVPVELELDELDADADHAVAMDGDRTVGTGRLVNGRVGPDLGLEPGTPGTVGTIGRMAVASDVRGAGLGRELLDVLVDRARALGLPAVELHAQVQATAFYERAGFAPFGDVYDEAGIAHVGMRREL